MFLIALIATTYLSLGLGCFNQSNPYQQPFDINKLATQFANLMDITDILIYMNGYSDKAIMGSMKYLNRQSKKWRVELVFRKGHWEWKENMERILHLMLPLCKEENVLGRDMHFNLDPNNFWMIPRHMLQGIFLLFQYISLFAMKYHYI